MALDALRVLAVACRDLEGNSELSEESVETDMVFLGLAGMIDPPREEAIEAIKTCKDVHIKPIMITGDHKLTALAIAKELAIYKDGDIALTGEELERMSDEQFEEIIECPFFYFIFFHDLGHIAHARTEIFFLFIIIEFVIAINCRSLIYSIFKAPPHKWLLIALAWELALIAMLIQIPTVRKAFGLIMSYFTDLSIIIGFGLIVFTIIKGTKVVLRKKVSVGRRINP